MIRIVGDVHGKVQAYHKIIQGCEFSVQIGDMGFEKAYQYLEQHLDPLHHRFFGGNHSNYDYLRDCPPPHYLKDFGVVTHGGVTFFFCRGAFSIDAKWRLRQEYQYGYKSWWQEEELGYAQLQNAIDLYKAFKPDVVLTHDCPLSITEIVGNADVLKDFGFETPPKSRTQQALQAMLEAHQPNQWLFGHFHTSKTFRIQSTTFQCLNELEWVDI